MNQGAIRISASMDEHGYGWGCFDVTISKGETTTHLTFFADEDTWKDFGKELSCFPVAVSATVSFEAGIIDTSDSYLKLQAYCFDAYGHAAIRVSVDNRKPDPDRCKLAFSIPAEIASINRLGHLLRNWRAENNTEILWQAQTS
ncbi:hypothetical protein [Hymenobacter glacieicola]|uniref:Uncharacterized protein n=1 Tax=Hymenobacter glacieicola TaxID=1562124 RepID=A0ABQ1X7D7_9BACT|nr:hypothetical protein [Hymenobacter glacieicola]GGG62152.1 hypothetical protein GCM10011378_42850 [Hymenobacter glacieicola]